MKNVENNCIVAGATGLVGSKLLSFLIKDTSINKIFVLSRRDLVGIDSNKVHCILVDFDNLEKLPLNISVHSVFCCLGTTIKKAKSKDAFKKVDFNYVLALAKLGLRLNAKHFLMVSAAGANPNSIFFYNKVKGLVEAHLVGLNYEKLSVFRPSLILGKRKDTRLAEELSKKISQLVPSIFLFGYEPIQARQIAHCMLRAHKCQGEKFRLYENVEMLKTK